MSKIRFSINVDNLERLQQALLNCQGNAEATINDVLHNEGTELAQNAIYNLMPISGKTWRGKKPAAKHSKSLFASKGNLNFVITTNSGYGYLYFPDDGTNTRRHVGNQQFFWRGLESVEDDIVDRCINRLTTNFENEV